MRARPVVAIGFSLGGVGAVEARPEGLWLTPTGTLGTVAGDAAVRQALLLLLTTTPGERVMRPTYGCPLHRLLFATNDETTAGLAIHYVRQAVERFEPRAAVVRLDAAADPDATERLVVTLHYRVVASDTHDTMRVDVDVAGGAGTREAGR